MKTHLDWSAYKDAAMGNAAADNPAATVVANGFSCQHQIREGCDHQPIHIAVLLRDAMIQPGAPA